MLRVRSAAFLSTLADAPMLRPVAFVILVSVLTACGPKSQQAGQSTADSTASGSVFTDSAKAQDSIGPAPSTDSAASSTDSAASSTDSTRSSLGAPRVMRPAGAVASQVRDSTASMSASKAPRPAPYIGRDSAFGPTFTVDSTGKVTPIVPAKKKP